MALLLAIFVGIAMPFISSSEVGTSMRDEVRPSPSVP
jgi:hypothetical protein